MQDKNKLTQFLNFLVSKLWQIFLSILGTMILFLPKIFGSLKESLNKKITIQLTLYHILIIVFACLTFLILHILYNKKHLKKRTSKTTIDITSLKDNLYFKNFKYVLYKNFCWKVYKNKQNMYETDNAPMCPICKTIPIFSEKNEWDGFNYNCLHCNTDFNSENIFRMRQSLLNILSSQGFNFFDKTFINHASQIITQVII